MPRLTGHHEITKYGDEDVRAFVPEPLPPTNPPLYYQPEQLWKAEQALSRLDVASRMVPAMDWFIYAFVRKEAVVSSQIEGTQATLMDVLTYEASQTEQSGGTRTPNLVDVVEDISEVCNYLNGLKYARDQLASSDGLPLSLRLLRQVHERLMRGVRGADKRPGEFRTSQNWIGGTRPGNAHFVPPPPSQLMDCLGKLELFLHEDTGLPPLVRAGLIHVQFETIHPFLDGNGRLGRLLVTLLLEYWKILSAPLLYLSLYFKRHRNEYYARLSAVRAQGDWEGWMQFFLEGVDTIAREATEAAQMLFTCIDEDRHLLLARREVTISAVQLFERLPNNPVVTVAKTAEMLGVSKPTAAKTISILQASKILSEITGKLRDRSFGYSKYLTILCTDTDPVRTTSTT